MRIWGPVLLAICLLAAGVAATNNGAHAPRLLPGTYMMTWKALRPRCSVAGARLQAALCCLATAGPACTSWMGHRACSSSRDGPALSAGSAGAAQSPPSCARARRGDFWSSAFCVRASHAAPASDMLLNSPHPLLPCLQGL